jgi:hypothetical protein
VVAQAVAMILLVLLEATHLHFHKLLQVVVLEELMVDQAEVTEVLEVVQELFLQTNQVFQVLVVQVIHPQ